MNVGTLVIIISVIAIVEGLVAFVRGADLYMQASALLACLLGMVLFVFAAGWSVGMMGEPPPRLSLEQACARSMQSAHDRWSISWVCE